MIIAICGVDGSGKSTIAKLLASMMRMRFNTRVLWIKSLHTLAYLIYRLAISVRGIEYVVNPCGFRVEHFVTMWMKNLGVLWGFIETLSLIPWLIILYIYNALGYVIICDRFLIDFLATVSLRTNDNLWWIRSLYSIPLINLQRKVLTIHLRISLNTILKRRPSIEYNVEELKHIVALYRVIARYINAYEVINENKSLSKTLKEVMGIIAKNMSR